MTEDSFPCARFIKEIGRGTHGARALSREDTAQLYAAMLAGRVSDLELGAIMLAYRIKGETAVELGAMLAAAHATLTPLRTPSGGPRGVSIPSYNGARKQPNLVPLLALLLAREGIPVLVHGVQRDPGRVTSAEIFAALGVEAAASLDDANAALAAGHVAFAPIEVLAPPLARLLATRRVLGVRNSTHTLVKLLQPFDTPGLRLVNYTHPAYRESLLELFLADAEAAAGDVLLARGTEGEAVADTRRQVQIDWLQEGRLRTLAQAAARSTELAPDPLPLSRDAAATAQWIGAVLAGEAPVPVSIDTQLRLIMKVLVVTTESAA